MYALLKAATPSVPCHPPPIEYAAIFEPPRSDSDASREAYVPARTSASSVAGPAPRLVNICTTPLIASAPYSALAGPYNISIRSTLSSERFSKNWIPPTALMGVPSINTLVYRLSPPRRNSDVTPPYDPLCTTAAPGASRSASATVTTPRARSSSPLRTVTGWLTEDDGVGSRVAVTTTGWSDVVVSARCANAAAGNSASKIIADLFMDSVSCVFMLSDVMGQASEHSQPDRASPRAASHTRVRAARRASRYRAYRSRQLTLCATKSSTSQIARRGSTGD